MDAGNTKSLQQLTSNGRHSDLAPATGGQAAATYNTYNGEQVDDHHHIVEFAASKRGRDAKVRHDEWAKITHLQQDRQDAEMKSKALERQRYKQGYAKELNEQMG